MTEKDILKKKVNNLLKSPNLIDLTGATDLVDLPCIRYEYHWKTL